MTTGPAARLPPLWMWAAVALPSIFLISNFQQTLPLVVFSVIFASPRPSGVPRGFSARPVMCPSSVVVTDEAADAPMAATPMTPIASAASAVRRVRIRFLLTGLPSACRRHSASTQEVGVRFGPPSYLDGRQFVAQVRRDRPLDSRRAGAALEPGDDALPLHQHERRHRLYVEALGDRRLLVHVDAGDPQARPLLALEMRQQALHAPGRA